MKDKPKLARPSLKQGTISMPKFQVPPEVLIFHELRRLERLQRPAPLGHCSHVD